MGRYVYKNIPLMSLKITSTGQPLSATPGATNHAIVPGTFGSANPAVDSNANAAGNSVTNKSRFEHTLDNDYPDGKPITIRVTAKISGAVAVAQTLDCEVFKDTAGAALGSDLVTTAAQSLTTSFADYDFVVTPTGLVKGDKLDVQLTTVNNDTGGSTTEKITISKIVAVYDRQNVIS